MVRYLVFFGVVRRYGMTSWQDSAFFPSRVPFCSVADRGWFVLGSCFMGVQVDRKALDQRQQREAATTYIVCGQIGSTQPPAILSKRINHITACCET